MSHFFRSKSFTSLNSRPSLPPASPSWPDSYQRIGSSTPSDGATIPQPTDAYTTENSPPSLTSIHSEWTLGLEQYASFHLHAALSTFKRILRTLRIPAEEIPIPITESVVRPTSIPYRLLQPEEVALLYINIALIHAYLGSYFLAAQAFQEALELDKTSGVAWFGLGLVRFYTRELRASKIAFGDCLKCFIARNANGDRYFQEELIYGVWPGPLGQFSRTKIVEENGGSEGSATNLDSFEGILGGWLPDNQWKLERARVEWNWRNALFERNWVRKGVEKPGNWGLNGIPAGVIFALDTTATRGSIAERVATDIDLKDAPTLGLADIAPVNQRKSTKGSLVKRKWTGIQEKFLNREPSTTKGTRLLRSAASSNYIPFPAFTNNQSPFDDSSVDVLQTPIQAASLRSLVLGDVSLPPTSPSSLQPSSPSTSYTVRSHDFEDNYIRGASDHQAISAPEAQRIYPIRQSSLFVSPTYLHRPHSKGLRLSVNTAIHDIDKIEEEHIDDEDGYLEQDRPDSPDSARISPHDTSHGIRNIVQPPVFTQDFIAVPYTRRRSESRSRSKSSKSPLSNPAQDAEYGHDSFMTDAISSLGSGMPSMFFPLLASDHSRRPSHATDISFIEVEADGNGDAENNAGDPNTRRPSAMLTITPATPLQSDDRYGPMIVSSTGEWTESEVYLGCSPRLDTEALERLCDAENAKMASSRMGKMNITERTCLGEWEYEEEYRQWYGTLTPEDISNGSTEGIQGADDEEEEDYEYNFGEMLRPVVFEGFG
ncbi:MAG: hypothetical protein Q9213_005513 [Squamulea squamosa]